MSTPTESRTTGDPRPEQRRARRGRDGIEDPGSTASRLAHLGRVLTDRVFKSKRLGLIFLSLIVVTSFFYELTPVDGIVLCPIRASTGMECGGCGMTRSWVALAHGELSLSVMMNPFGPLLFGLALAKISTLGVEVGYRRELVLPWWERVKVPVLGTVAAGLIGLSLIRAVEFFTS